MTMKKHVLEYFITDGGSSNIVQDMEFGPTILTESIESSDPDGFVTDENLDLYKLLKDEKYLNYGDFDMFLLL